MGLGSFYRSSSLYFGFIVCLFGFKSVTLHAETVTEGTALAAIEPAAAPPAASPGAEAAGVAGPEVPVPMIAGPAPAVPSPLPMVKGFNFSLNQTEQHSSVNGWSTTMTPDLSYTFNRRIIIDCSTPWVQYYLGFPVTSTSSSGALTTGTNLLGDTSLSGHYFGNIRRFDEFISGTLGIPTGDAEFGLSANQFTYNITNHIDHGISIFTPDVEFGFGDSSSLVKTGAKKAYTAVGPLANFQTGSLIDMPFSADLDIEVYEDLPVGNQDVYGTITRRSHGKTVTTQVLEGSGVAEDNGVTAEFDIPVHQHIIFSGTYERSLRQNTDIAAIGVTFFLRTPKKSLIQQIADELR